MVKKRGKDTWWIRIYLGKGSDGKPKYYHETFRAPLKSIAQDRERELKKMLSAQKMGTQQLLMNIGELLDAWLEIVKEQGVASDRTIETYTYHVKRLRPIVGSISLYGLTAFEVQNALSGQFPELASATKKGIYGTLRTALRQGFRWGVLSTDIANGIVAPQGEATKEKIVLDIDQLLMLLECLKGYKHHLVLRLLAVTGARLGEVLGLQWGDIDFEKGSMAIVRSADSRNRKLNPKPKTRSSRRTILLDAETMDLLREYKKLHNPKTVSINRTTRQEQLIFHSEDGRPLRHRAIQLTLKRALKKAKLPETNIHGLRHSVSTILMDSGVSTTDLIALLGHVSIRSTEPYLHHQRQGVNMLDFLRLGSNLGSKD